MPWVAVYRVNGEGSVNARLAPCGKAARGDPYRTKEQIDTLYRRTKPAGEERLYPDA